ncbi:HAD family phosphatase [Telmatospirillum sp.]|uniref:HAD family hydrolase n=1 Tax=Telmatospirillum sp. TaxID=2079197 RepID=UPI002841A583|nr:HAD family phosphatase [Telmatospirillum sp.]MDR3437379.1 HAD family phosphatase [Telmatospirillum sp.]
MSVSVRNIVFDLGNVVVRWDPALIVARTFGEATATPEFVRSIFAHPLWLELNRGEITEEQAKRAYCSRLGVTTDQIGQLFFHIKNSQTLVPGALELMEQAAAAGLRLFALSDNVHEIVLHLRKTYDFWRYFEGVVISAELGILKPDPRIFTHLLNTFVLEPKETVFLDDLARNVEGARAVGMHAVHFIDAERAAVELEALGVRI